MTDSNTIRWETHDEEEDSFQSVCGRFEARLDPVYGYFCLHDIEDPAQSLAESTSLTELAQCAAAHLGAAITA